MWHCLAPVSEVEVAGTTSWPFTCSHHLLYSVRKIDFRDGLQGKIDNYYYYFFFFTTRRSLTGRDDDNYDDGNDDVPAAIMIRL